MNKLTQSYFKGNGRNTEETTFNNETQARTQLWPHIETFVILLQYREC